jgi:hypothetical protein
MNKPDNANEQAEAVYGYGLQGTTLFRLILRRHLGKISVVKWSTLLSAIGFAVGTLWGFMKTLLYEQPKVLTTPDCFVVAMVCGLWGCVGFLYAYRKEIPLLETVRGFPARVMGIFMAIVFWGLSICGVISGWARITAWLLSR